MVINSKGFREKIFRYYLVNQDTCAAVYGRQEIREYLENKLELLSGYDNYYLEPVTGHHWVLHKVEI